jgi:ABC-type bacteriocin/lantibiotic exporter with double-glycine peptidase domain
MRAALAAVQAAVGAVAGAVVLIVGGVAVARGSMKIGDLLAFYAVMAILIRQLQVIASGFSTATIGAECLRRLEGLLATPLDDPYPSGRRALDFSGAIALEHVTFSYGSTPVIQDLAIAIAPSEIVAIMGPNGAGKSTLVSLIVGLYRPQTGRVLADGVPFDELAIGTFRRQIGVVLQDPVLLPATIRENIAYGRPDATDDEVRAAAVTATAATFIDRLPAGYETRVGDEGIGLSGGQRQRIAVARALLGEPALLLLDEPTTYLDEAGAAALMANLERLPRSPTVVIVTHDPHAAAHADRTIELRDGRVASDSAAAPVS